MRLFRLAKILERRYSLKAEAADLQQVMNDVKKDVINAYKLYVSGKTAKEPVLQLLANHKEQFSKAVVSIMEDIIANIDTYTPVQLFNRINKILGLINPKIVEEGQLTKDMARKFIDNSISENMSRESIRNWRDHVKVKFEMVTSRLSSILEKQAKILQKFLPKEVPLEGGGAERQRGELSKEKLRRFMETPAAQKYGLDNMDIMQKVLFYPDLRDLVTTIINSIDRGHTPLDGPKIMEEAKEIAEALKLKQTNEPFFGANEEQAKKQLKYQHPTPEQIAGKETAEREAEELKKKRLQENKEFSDMVKKQEEEKLLNKYNSLSFSDWLNGSDK